MPIVAVPLTSSPATVRCDVQRILIADIEQQNGCDVLGKRMAITVAQGQSAIIQWTLRDRHGNPIDLRSCGLPCPPQTSSSSSSSSTPSSVPPSSSLSSSSSMAMQCSAVVLRIREALTTSCCSIEITGTVIDAANGVVQFELTAPAVAFAGIYLAEAGLIDAEGNLLFSNIFYMTVEPGQFGVCMSNRGPLTISEIRLHLRDNHPSDNLLLDAIAYSDAEIMACMMRPLDYWNDTPPPLGDRVNTQNFPFRWAWLEGTIASLFLLAAESYRRNSLTYNAAGVAINDKDKFREYEDAGRARWTSFQQWCKQTKVSINMESCYGSVGSTYGMVGRTGVTRVF